MSAPLTAQSTYGFERLFKVDHRSLVSRAELRYTTPVERSEQGMPIGNGRTGSLVRTRSDVRDVHEDLRRVRRSGARAVGQPGDLDSGDDLLQRPGETAGRYRGGDARALPPAQAVERAQRRSPPTRADGSVRSAAAGTGSPRAGGGSAAGGCTRIKARRRSGTSRTSSARRR